MEAAGPRADLRYPWAKLENTPVPPYQLFHLEEDPGETEDLYESRPEIAAPMKERLQEIIDAGRTRG